MRGDIHPEGKEKALTLCLHLIRTSHRSSSELWTATTAEGEGEGEGGGVGGGEPNGGP